MIHHVGLTVTDLETSLEFYRRLLGGETEGPFERSGPRIDEVTGHPGAVVRQGFLRPAQGQTVIEVLEYRGVATRPLDPDNARPGAVHVAVVVEDLDDVLATARERGVTALSDPIELSAPLAGHRAVYVLDPDRIRVELVEPPDPGAGSVT